MTLNFIYVDRPALTKGQEEDVCIWAKLNSYQLLTFTVMIMEPADICSSEDWM